ncbi:MAG: hypothetical protein ACK2UU_03315, partial [Anaerolineae bacterium]
MTPFPRTQIEGLSVPRMIIGTNWFMGFSHTSAAQSKFIKELQGPKQIADVMEVFFDAGINATLGGQPHDDHFIKAVQDVQDRTGQKCIWIGTPSFDLSGTQEANDKNNRILDAFAEKGCTICGPHQSTTDALLDRRARCIRDIDPITEAIRDRGMIPFLSTHMPETPIYADETGIDVASYIQIYNAAGFLMQIEIDWVQRMIWRRKKPVITIKPLAAGRLPPLVGLAFAWSTIRDQDMVCIGCMTPDEAKEVIEISFAQLERRAPEIQLQTTR